MELTSTPRKGGEKGGIEKERWNMGMRNFYDVSQARGVNLHRKIHTIR